MLFLWLQCNTQKLLEIRFAVDSKCCGFRSEVFCRLRLQVCSIPEPKSDFNLRLCALGSGNDKNTFPSPFVGSGSS